MGITATRKTVQHSCKCNGTVHYKSSREKSFYMFILILFIDFAGPLVHKKLDDKSFFCCSLIKLHSLYKIFMHDIL